MGQNTKSKRHDNTALRRALHIQADDRSYVIEDEIGFKLINPESDWQERPDMKSLYATGEEKVNFTMGIVLVAVADTGEIHRRI